MYSLLPQENVSELIKNYHRRLLAVFFFFASFVIVLGVIALLPSYIVAQSFEKEAALKVQAAAAQRKLPQSVDMEEKANAMSLLLKDFNAFDRSFVPSKILHNLITARGGGTTITSFEMARIKENNLIVVIKGSATTRENLIDFKKRLSGLEGILKVDLPVADLADSKDLEYTITVTLSLKESAN